MSKSKTGSALPGKKQSVTDDDIEKMLANLKVPDH
jgi:hypothetical protein